MSTLRTIEFNRRLASEVKRWSCLYDSHRKHDRQLINRAWEEVTMAMKEPNLTVDECKRKWLNLRAQYYRAQKSGEVHLLAAELVFLFPHLKIYQRRPKETAEQEDSVNPVSLGLILQKLLVSNHRVESTKSVPGPVGNQSDSGTASLLMPGSGTSKGSAEGISSSGGSGLSLLTNHRSTDSESAKAAKSSVTDEIYPKKRESQMKKKIADINEDIKRGQVKRKRKLDTTATSKKMRPDITKSKISEKSMETIDNFHKILCPRLQTLNKGLKLAFMAKVISILQELQQGAS